jgi:hypothetical protein
VVTTGNPGSLTPGHFPDMAASRFTDADFNAPRNDLDLYRLYTSGEFDTWLIDKKSSLIILIMPTVPAKVPGKIFKMCFCRATSG